MDITPIVVFQFVLKDTSKPISLNNIRHWRFVSWLNKVPTTLNNRQSTLKKNISLVRESQTDDDRLVYLKTRSSQSFVDTLYTWNVEVSVPLVTPER